MPPKQLIASHGHRLKKAAGFSLVQILIALGICAFLASLSAPAIKRLEPNLKLLADARQLASELRLAQQRTISEQQVYYVEINQPDRRYFLFRQDSPANPLKTTALDPKVSFQSITGFDNNRVVYNSYGAVSQAGQIVLASQTGKTYTINVKPSGYVQLTQ